MATSSILKILVLALCSWNAQAQYGSLTSTQTPFAVLKPSAQAQPAGGFTWPLGPGANTFTKGSSMNISWTTDYASVSLYLIINNQFNKPVTLLTNTRNTSYEWRVDCHYNCAADPLTFVFHIVDASGDESELSDGGFWSRHFWIMATTSTSATTASPTSMTSTPADQSTTLVSQKNPSRNNNVIGIGVGVGVGAAALLGAGGFFLWRRYRNKTKRYSYPRGPGVGQTGPRRDDQEQLQAYAKPMSASPPAELGPKDPVEVDGRSVNFPNAFFNRHISLAAQELPTRQD